MCLSPLYHHAKYHLYFCPLAFMCAVYACLFVCVRVLYTPSFLMCMYVHISVYPRESYL